MLVVSLGASAASVVTTVAAMKGTGEEDAGLARGVSTAAQQVGSAVGLAAIISLAAGRAGGLLAAGTPAVGSDHPNARTTGSLERKP